jgi:GNAT superfamily N-acetyltransferase
VTTSPETPASTTSTNWRWVPVRSLGQRHRDRIAAHLLALDAEDRYLRFGNPAPDTQIGKYVDMLDFEHDEVFGIFNRRLDLVAMAHLAHPNDPVEAGKQRMSEFGVSVLKSARGRGFGKRLFEHAILHARNRGVRLLFIHALSENAVMLKIARNAGATLRRDGSESDAWLELPEDSIASHLGQLVEEQAAELDYHLKLRARQVGTVIDTLAEIKSRVREVSQVDKN